MASRFESDLVGSSWDVLSSVHGEIVHYVPGAGGAKDITGILSPFETLPDPELEGRELVRTTLEVNSADVAAPNELDRVTARTLIFAVKDFDLSAFGWLIRLEHARQHVSGGDGTHLELTG